MTPGLHIDVSIRMIFVFKGGDLTTSPASVSNLRFPAHEQHTSMFISGYMQIYISTKRVESSIIVTENKLGHRGTMFEGDCDKL
jgi:hypothetical protein